jgi:hypothetical protein
MLYVRYNVIMNAAVNMVRGFFRSVLSSRRKAKPEPIKAATGFHETLVTMVDLYTQARAREDWQAARYFAVAVYAMLGPSKAKGMLVLDSEGDDDIVF